MKLIALSLLAVLSFADFKTVTPRALHGQYELVYEGCEDVPTKARLTNTKENKEQGISVYLGVFGDQIVEQRYFGLFCVMQMQSRALERTRRDFIVEFEYGKVSNVCADDFGDVFPKNKYTYNMSFSDKLITNLEGELKNVSTISLNGKAFACNEGVRYEFAYKRRSMMDIISDNLSSFYYMISQLVYKGEMEKLVEFVTTNIEGADLSVLDTENRDEQGRTLLMQAVLGGDSEMVKTFLELGGSLKAKDAIGATALDYANISDNKELSGLISNYTN